MALPKFEDWLAPWETETGEVEIDKPKLKKYLFNLLTDKERLQGTVTTVTEERNTLKSAADAEARKGETDTQRLERENKELQEKLAKAGETSTETLRLQVALEKGLTAAQAKRLVGSNLEELQADADSYLEDLKPAGDEAPQPPSQRPRRGVNPADPDPEGGSEVTVEQLLASVPRL